MRTILNRNIWFTLIIVGCLVGSGCSTVNSKVGGAFNLKTDLRIRFNVAENINPDESSQPKPVIVRLYELTDPTLFDRADFIDLFENDEAILGDTFISKRVLQPLVPGTRFDDSMVLGKETEFVGIFVEFLRYNESKSVVTFPVTSSNVIRDSVRIEISGNSIKLLQ